jgi:ABC-type multidrug transport system ATPase subunit
VLARSAIEAVALATRYSDVEAVCGVSFRVPPREIVAFLGPNGAGPAA